MYGGVGRQVISRPTATWGRAWAWKNARGLVAGAAPGAAFGGGARLFAGRPIYCGRYREGSGREGI